MNNGEWRMNKGNALAPLTSTAVPPLTPTLSPEYEGEGADASPV